MGVGRDGPAREVTVGVSRCPLCGLELDPGVMACPRDGSLVVVGGRQDPLVGATLGGRYKILSALARGGMSSVYLARHVLIERLSAIKILRRDLCDDPVQRDRFLREARAVNRINHPNIVEITDYGESEDGRVFLVMEYLPGESLLQRVSRGALDPLRSLDIATQIASGLARAHQMGVIHRDLKPDNVLLLPTSHEGRDSVKLLDFGIAKMLDQPSLTATDKIFGTPGYIAPEYAAGAPIDGRADIYSLGAVLYEMVTAQLPFDCEFPGDMLLKHMTEPPIPPRVRNPSVPEVVERLILQMLEKDPNKRFRDAYHLLETLNDVRIALTGSVDAASTPTPELTEINVPRREQPGASFRVAPVQEIGTGVLGGRAWHRFVSTLRADLDRGDRHGHADLRRLAGEMDGHVERMAARTVYIDKLKHRMLALEARGRDFRATIGRAVDTLAGDLSTRTRDRDALSEERSRLEIERAEIEVRGPRDAVDAILWRIAACDELLREAVAACEDVEYQLAELDRQLVRLSESLEGDQTDLIADLEATMHQLADEDAALRALATEAAAARA